MNYNRGELAIGGRILFMRHDKVLLGLRQGTKYANGKWMLPGGVTDRYETALESAIREAAEEVGLVVRPDQLSFVGVAHWYKPDRDIDGITCNWVCYDWSCEDPNSREPINKETEKCQSLNWFNYEQIEALEAQGLMESTSYGILKDFLQGKKCVYVDCDWPERVNS